MVDKVVRRFEVPLKTMEEVELSMMEELKRGLEEEGEHVKVKMLITFVHSIPSNEEGEFLYVDFGGSNLRVGRMKIKDGKVVGDPDPIKHPIDDLKLKEKRSAVELFDCVAEVVAEFIEKEKITKRLPLGFTFSYPVKNLSLNSGELLRWTKGFQASDAVGKDPVTLLNAAFKRKGVNADIKALINDTTGTLLAVAGQDVPDCHIGLILGTGSNACYMERFDAATIPKFKGQFGKHTQVVINCESGAFGEDGQLEELKVMTDYDKQLDAELPKDEQGQQPYEKMISGEYLGEIVRLALKSLIKCGDPGSLFSGKSSTKFDEPKKFETAYASDIEKWYRDDKNENKDDFKRLLKKLLLEKFSLEASDSDCEVVRRVCEAVSTRAARLAATGVVTLVKKIDKLSGCTVAVDGTLYKEYPKFDERMKAAMDELAPGHNIKLKLSTDGSGRGAAIAAAMACQMEAI